MPAYFIKGAGEILSESRIRHFVPKKRKVETSGPWLPEKRPVDVALSSGASCPDAVMDEVLIRVLSFFEKTQPLDRVLQRYPQIAA